MAVARLFTPNLKFLKYIIAFLKVFVMYGAWLARTNFLLSGACLLFSISRKILSNNS